MGDLFKNIHEYMKNLPICKLDEGGPPNKEEVKDAGNEQLSEDDSVG